MDINPPIPDSIIVHTSDIANNKEIIEMGINKNTNFLLNLKTFIGIVADTIKVYHIILFNVS